MGAKRDGSRVTTAVMLHSTESMTELVAFEQPPQSLRPQQADNDTHLVELWLHGRCENRQGEQ